LPDKIKMLKLLKLIKKQEDLLGKWQSLVKILSLL